MLNPLFLILVDINSHTKEQLKQPDMNVGNQSTWRKPIYRRGDMLTANTTRIVFVGKKNQHLKIILKSDYQEEETEKYI